MKYFKNMVSYLEKLLFCADNVDDKASANSRTSLVMQENHVLCLLTGYLLKIGQLCSNYSLNTGNDSG